jgi:hypothetical protein
MKLREGREFGFEKIDEGGGESHTGRKPCSMNWVETATI